MYPGQFEVSICTVYSITQRTKRHFYGFFSIEFDSGMILEFASNCARRGKLTREYSRYMGSHLKICDHERQAS